MKRKIIAKIDTSKPLSSKAFMNLVLFFWILSMGGLIAVAHFPEKDISEQIKKNDMEKGTIIENR